MTRASVPREGKEEKERKIAKGSVARPLRKGVIIPYEGPTPQ